MTSWAGEYFFFKKQVANILNVKIQLDLYVYTSYVNHELFKSFIEIWLKIVDVSRTGHNEKDEKFSD